MASEKMIGGDEKSKNIFLIYVGLGPVIPARVWTVPALNALLLGSDTAIRHKEYVSHSHKSYY
jgi:hypothetical protein